MFYNIYPSIKNVSYYAVLFVCLIYLMGRPASGFY